MDSLKLSVLTPHHATTGCRCRECFGLAEFMLATTGDDHGLPRLEAPQTGQKLVLSLVDPCTGGLTCECDSCTTERLRAIERQKSSRPKQPWDVKAA